MAICKDCLHYDVCERYGRTVDFPVDDGVCLDFADRARYVVREKGVAAAVMKRLLDGEWVETQEVEEALGIDFSEGMKLFDFGRTAAWNPAPLNGQKITTKFKLKTSEEIVELKADNERLRDMWAKAVSELSKATAEQRPKGEWIGEADGYADGELVYDVWYCSECNHCIDDGTDDPALLPNFCPQCGADMRKGENDG